MIHSDIFQCTIARKQKYNNVRSFKKRLFMRMCCYKKERKIKFLAKQDFLFTKRLYAFIGIFFRIGGMFIQRITKL